MKPKNQHNSQSRTKAAIAFHAVDKSMMSLALSLVTSNIRRLGFCELVLDLIVLDGGQGLAAQKYDPRALGFYAPSDSSSRSSSFVMTMSRKVGNL